MILSIMFLNFLILSLSLCRWIYTYKCESIVKALEESISYPCENKLYGNSMEMLNMVPSRFIDYWHTRWNWELLRDKIAPSSKLLVTYVDDF